MDMCSFRINLQVLVVFSVLCLVNFIDAKNTPSLGIIRWDAFNQVNGKYDEISYYSHRAMTPVQFHYRLPFYATVSGPNNISYNADEQSVMDQEILYASKAGLDYWVFDTYCTYGSNCTVSTTTNSSRCTQYIQDNPGYCPLNPAYGLDLYLSSEYSHLLNFSLVLLGTLICDSGLQKQYVELMANPLFHTVLEGRPIVYLFQFSDQQINECGGLSDTQALFQNFRQMATDRGLKNPYIVLMDVNWPQNIVPNAQALGLDAVSAYALPGGSVQGTPFDVLLQNAQSWWRQADGLKFPFVPIAPTGWDPRPRALNEPPWVNEGPEYYIQTTAEEMQNLISSAIEFACTHNITVESQSIIIYAWNELSENGATLIPSLGNGTLYIDALSEISPLSC
eukprot:TRINITY_DN5778_c0_g1_i2.p1 TRINITY_DN5778_c0_g1~~TRINITY_DN5778_c0_g1_i2.p1  ORF type:complete len:394 (-),score=61.53 TRINITY_DN5778_c0_g1_i2:28-1209(-)